MKAFAITGYSGSGKTTLIEKLLPLLTQRGLRVSVIKHAHHDFDVDRPGKDSFRHRQAGAAEVLLAANARWVLMSELRGAPEPTLAEYLSRFSPCDLVLVEGFKHAEVRKLEVYRAANGKPPLWPDDPSIVAVATDVALPGLAAGGPVALNLDDAAAIARFILAALHIDGEANVILR